MNTRRNFIKKATITAGLATVGMNSILNAQENKSASAPKIKLKENAVILFQGDSITDAGRGRGTNDYNETSNLGNRYAMLAAAKLLETYPEKKLKIYNKGVSGDKVHQLRNRWDSDCIDIKPDVLSILIGVNDFWHTLDFGYKATVKNYEDDYRALLEYTKEKLPDTQLIIGEPFGILNGGAVKDSWYPEFDKYRAVAKKMAEEFNAVFIPYQSIFDKAQKLKIESNKYWVPDGVHPSLAGAALMARTWTDLCI